MLNILDKVLFVALVVGMFIGIAKTSGGPNPKDECEKKGGRYIQTMKSYHTCKMETMVSK